MSVPWSLDATGIVDEVAHAQLTGNLTRPHLLDEWSLSSKVNKITEVNGQRFGISIDCTGLEYIDAHGGRALMLAYAPFKKAGREFSLVNVPPHLRPLLDRGGLPQIGLPVSYHPSTEQRSA